MNTPHNDTSSVDFNATANFIYYELGLDPIPVDSKNRKRAYAGWEGKDHKPFTEEQFKALKASGAYNKGIGAAMGPVLRNGSIGKIGMYANCIDGDNAIAVQELFTSYKGSPKEFGKWTWLMMHKDNPDKAKAIIFSTDKPFCTKSSDNSRDLEVTAGKAPSIEVLGLGRLAVVPPSIHKDEDTGVECPYETIGTDIPVIDNDFEQHIDNICNKYGIKYLEGAQTKTITGPDGTTTTTTYTRSQTPIQELLKPDYKIVKGNNRHGTLLRIMDHLLIKFGTWDLEFVKSLALEWNEQHCIAEDGSPAPVDSKDCEQLFKQSQQWVAKKAGEQKSKIQISKNDKDKKKQYNVDEANEEAENGEGEDNGDRRRHFREKTDLAFAKAKKIFQPLFKDQFGACYTWTKIPGKAHREIVKIGRGKFKQLLLKIFYDTVGEVPKANTIDIWVDTFHALAGFDGPTYELASRVAWYGNNNNDNGQQQEIYYDLTNDNWSCIKVTPFGWEVVKETPKPLLIRHNEKPQVLPDKNYEPDIFDRFLKLINAKTGAEDKQILFKVYTMTLFIPEIAHVILVLHAPKGSAKSTAQTLIKLLIDPSKPQLLTIHKDRQEFIQQLAHNYVCYYDNVKQVPDWLSHEVCKAVTGVGQTKRKLFTDEEDIIFEYKRCLGFNGINVALTEPDALERSLMIDLEAIKKENRRLEAEVLAEFYELKPRLLGYIFDILVKAMQIKPTLQLKNLPRMADFAVWGEAIARAMGYKDLEFIKAYDSNIGTQNVEAIENSMLGQAILKWFENLTIDPKTRLWEGATADVLEVLNNRAEEYKINVRSKDWPKSANSFTRRLKTIVPSLKDGFDMNIEIAKDSVGRITGRKGASIIRVWKVSSPPSPPPFEHENRKNTLANKPGSEDNTLTETSPNTLAMEGSIESSEDISLTANSEIRAQSEDIRPSEDSEAIFDTSILFRCYYCNVFITDSKQHYLNHGAIKHPRKPMFPTKAEIQKYGLQSQGRRWEV